MKNYKYLLLVSTCLLFNNNLSASELDLTFNSSSLPLGINTTLHTHTPNVELKPISSFVKLAAVCSVGGGGCSSDTNFNVDDSFQCKDAGFTLSGNCPNGASRANICPHNSAYFKSCICDTTRFTKSGSYYGQCGNLADVETCTTSSGQKFYRCNCDISFVTKCNASNQYAASGADVCRDSQNGDYIANTSCRTCNLPAIVNSTKNGCACPSSYAACGLNQSGVGIACTADGGNKFTSCECLASWAECGINQEGVGLPCTLGGKSKFESCKCSPSYSWSTCSDTAPGVGAKACNLNGTNYYSACKPKTCEANITSNRPSLTKVRTYAELAEKTMSGEEIIVMNDIIDSGNKLYIGNGTKIYSANAFNDELCPETKLNIGQAEFSKSSTLNISVTASEFTFKGSSLSFNKDIRASTANFSSGMSALTTTNNSRFITTTFNVHTIMNPIQNLTAENLNATGGRLHIKGDSNITNFNISAGVYIIIKGGNHTFRNLNIEGQPYKLTDIDIYEAEISSNNWSIEQKFPGPDGGGLEVTVNLYGGTRVIFEKDRNSMIKHSGNEAKYYPAEFIITLNSGSIIENLSQIYMNSAYGMQIVIPEYSKSYVSMSPSNGRPVSKMEPRDIYTETTFKIAARMSGLNETGYAFYTEDKKGLCDSDAPQAICNNMKNATDRVEPFCTYTEVNKPDFSTCNKCTRGKSTYYAANCKPDCDLQKTTNSAKCDTNYELCRCTINGECGNYNTAQQALYNNECANLHCCDTTKDNCKSDVNHDYNQCKSNSPNSL